MYIENGIAYAGTPTKEIRMRAVKPLDDMMMILTFTFGEKRLYDATQLLEFPAFQPLKDEAVFKSSPWNAVSLCGMTEKLILPLKLCMPTAMLMTKCPRDDGPRSRGWRYA